MDLRTVFLTNIELTEISFMSSNFRIKKEYKKLYPQEYRFDVNKKFENDITCNQLTITVVWPNGLDFYRIKRQMFRSFLKILKNRTFKLIFIKICNVLKFHHFL